MSEIAWASISWDGEALAVDMTTTHGPIRCVIPRDTINSITLFNDAVSWEIERYKTEIVDLLKRPILKKLDCGEIDRSGQTAKIRLEPVDLASVPSR